MTLWLLAWRCPIFFRPSTFFKSETRITTITNWKHFFIYIVIAFYCSAYIFDCFMLLLQKTVCFCLKNYYSLREFQTTLGIIRLNWDMPLLLDENILSTKIFFNWIESWLTSGQQGKKYFISSCLLTLACCTWNSNEAKPLPLTTTFFSNFA